MESPTGQFSHPFPGSYPSTLTPTHLHPHPPPAKRNGIEGQKDLRGAPRAKGYAPNATPAPSRHPSSHENQILTDVIFPKARGSPTLEGAWALSPSLDGQHSTCHGVIMNNQRNSRSKFTSPTQHK